MGCAGGTGVAPDEKSDSLPSHGVIRTWCNCVFPASRCKFFREPRIRTATVPETVYRIVHCLATDRSFDERADARFQAAGLMESGIAWLPWMDAKDLVGYLGIRIFRGICAPVSAR